MYSCLRILSPKVFIPLVTRASQHRPLGPPALNIFFESNLNFKGFHEVNRVTARAWTARGTSGIITFGEKDPKVTLTMRLLGPYVSLRSYFFWLR